jgi:cytoskeleton protein RodZ
MAGMTPEDDQEHAIGAREGMSFGAELRREREMRNISVREIADTTKISTRFLEAIESGDYESLPAPVFARGFIREYAGYLGLDAEDLVDRYMAIVDREERRQEDEEAEMRERVSGSFAGIPAGGAMKWVIGGLAVVAAVLLVVWLLMRGDGDATPREVNETAEPAPVVTPPVEPEPAATAEQVQLRLTATAESWINVRVDDAEPVDFTLASGQSRDLTAEREIELLTVGNAGGVAVTLNGVELERLGREGQVVRNRVFDLEYVNDLLQRRRAEEGAAVD